MSEPLTLFDYAQLDENTKILVWSKTGEIKALVKRSARDIIEIGQRLIEVKARLPHGQFGLWLEAEFGWSDSTALNFMRVANKFKSATVVDLNLSPKVLYLLAAPSTPDEARDEALALVDDGETITYTKAKELVNNHKVGYAELKPVEPYHKQAPDEAETKTKTLEPQDIEPPNPPTRYNPMLDHSRPRTLYTPQGLDACQTPAYALDPLLPYLDYSWKIWEPACGEGLLVEGFYDAGFPQQQVIGSDMIKGQDFYEYEPARWDCLITNPPFSDQFHWLERCYSFGKPFALLLKVDVLGTKTAQQLFKMHGLEIVLMDKRVNFKMPYKQYDGGGSWFAVAWYTWGLNIGQQMTFANITYEGRSNDDS